MWPQSPLLSAVAAVAEELHPRTVSSKQRIGGAIHERADSGLQQCARTHGARLQGHIQRRFAQLLPASDGASPSTQTEQLGVCGRVALCSAS